MGKWDHFTYYLPIFYGQLLLLNRHSLLLSWWLFLILGDVAFSWICCQLLQQMQAKLSRRLKKSKHRWLTAREKEQQMCIRKEYSFFLSIPKCLDMSVVTATACLLNTRRRFGETPTSFFVFDFSKYWQGRKRRLTRGIKFRDLLTIY